VNAFYATHSKCNHQRPPAAAVCTHSIGIVGLGKVNPIIAKLPNMKLASGMGNTTPVTRSVVVSLEKLIL